MFSQASRNTVGLRNLGVFVVTISLLFLVGCDDEGSRPPVAPSPPAPPVAGFVASPTTGTTPLEVHFTNTSKGEFTKCSWRFGDGRSAGCSSPSVTYNRAGEFNVTLTVTGPGGSDSKSHTIRISQGQSATFSDTRATGEWVTPNQYIATVYSKLNISGYKGRALVMGGYWFRLDSNGSYYYIKSECQSSVPGNLLGRQWRIYPTYDNSVFESLSFSTSAQCFPAIPAVALYARMKLYDTDELPLEPNTTTIARTRYVQIEGVNGAKAASVGDGDLYLRILSDEESAELERSIEAAGGIALP